MTFDELRLHPSLLRAVADEGYSIPTPIQMQAIPQVMQGGDLMGTAQTGTGKTAAFALPILHRLLQKYPEGGKGRTGKPPIRTLVLAPTRELAAQIGESFHTYGRHTGFRHTVIFGGVGQNPQVSALINGVDILIATPGRLLDLMNQGFVDFKQLEHLVLDEADNMLDMGFIHDIRKIVSRLPKQRQTLMFSATMPKEIRELANTILKNPVRVSVAPVSSAAETVEQSVYFVEKSQKPAMLVHYLNNKGIERVLVFSRTKHGADKIAKYLIRSGIRAEAIHGNKSQNARTRAMKNFKSDAPPVLIATDIAARGLDIDDVSHVVNYDLPNVPETYVHRIGRTGRAGATGVAVSFCDYEERAYLRDIERLTKIQVPVAEAPRQLPKPPTAPPHSQPAHQHTPAPAAHHPSRQHPSHGARGDSHRQQQSGGSHGSNRTYAAPTGRRQEEHAQNRPPQAPRSQAPRSQESRPQQTPKHAPASKPAAAAHPIHGASRGQGGKPRSSPASAHRHGGYNHPRNSGQGGGGGGARGHRKGPRFR